MFGRSQDLARVLQAGYVLRCKNARQERILREGLEIATAEGIPDTAHSRTCQYMRRLRLGLSTKQLADCSDVSLAPCRSLQYRSR
jgi:hypothetical protein